MQDHEKKEDSWKGSLKRLYENTERCISSKNPCKNTAFSHDRWKRLYENTELRALCISSKDPCKNTADSHDRWKRLYENTERCISSKNPCKNTTMSQARQKGAGKTQHFLQLVHCWEVLWDPRAMSMSKRSPSVIEPLDDMWWCNKKQKFENELDVYSMYVTIPFFYIKCLHLTGNLRSGTVDGQNIQTSRKGLEDTPFPKCQS